MPSIAYVDTETSGVQHFHELWEVGVVKVDENGEVTEYETQATPQSPAMADPFALRIGRFSERFNEMLVRPNGPEDVWKMLDGVTFAGITVSFDARMVGDWFLRNDLPPFPWHHRLLDVSTYAAGIAASAGLISPSDPLPGSDKIFKLYDVEISDKDRHTAIGDARATRELHVKAMGLAEELGNR